MPQRNVTSSALEASRVTSKGHGEEGGCVACQNPIHAHLDTSGAWVGCPEADDDTTFILVPVRTIRSNQPEIVNAAPVRSIGAKVVAPQHPFRRATDAGTNGTGKKHAAKLKTPVRTLRSATPIARPRYRYYVVDRRVRPVLSDVRGKVYDTLRAQPDGMLSRELIKKTKLVHGSVQQTLNWLRSAKMVRAAAIP